MRVLIIRGSDRALDSFAVVEDDFDPERLLQIRRTVEEKGGDLLVYQCSSLEDFEWYVKDCISL